MVRIHFPAQRGLRASFLFNLNFDIMNPLDMYLKLIKDLESLSEQFISIRVDNTDVYEMQKHIDIGKEAIVDEMTTEYTTQDLYLFCEKGKAEKLIQKIKGAGFSARICH